MKYASGDAIPGFIQENSDEFYKIYGKYGRSVYFFVCKLIGKRAEARDIAAETFVKLWLLRNHFNTEATRKAFLFIAARNACIDILRARRRQTAFTQEFSYLLSQAETISPEANEITVEVLQQIHAAIENLPTECRRIIKMAFLMGMKNGAIASQLDLSVQTVKNQKVNGLKLLREALGVLVKSKRKAGN